MKLSRSYRLRYQGSEKEYWHEVCSDLMLEILNVTAKGIFLR